MASDASPSKAAQGIKALNLNLGGRKSSAGTGGRGSDTGSAGINMPREHEELVKPVFDKYADKAGMLPVAKLGDFLAELKLSTSTDASQNVLNIVAGKSDTLTLDQT